MVRATKTPPRYRWPPSGPARETRVLPGLATRFHPASATQLLLPNLPQALPRRLCRLCRPQEAVPPPDWICSCCPNGERGSTDYDIHSSLRGKGSVQQTLGNQLSCPICLKDDRAPGLTKNKSGSKKFPDCGLRAHGCCLSELEVSLGGRCPCHECQRRRDRVVPGNNPVWLRLKMARQDGGPASLNRPMRAFLSC